MIRADDALLVYGFGDPAPGVTFYGLRSREGRTVPISPVDLWPAVEESRQSVLHNERWEVVVWDVAVAEWPEGDAWQAAVRASLEVMLGHGAVVAWCGIEGVFADPPDLFNPESMRGGVYAALAPETGFICRTRPGDQFEGLTDEELLQLRAIAKPVWAQN